MSKPRRGWDRPGESGSGTTLRFDADPAESSLAVFDPIERQRYAVSVSTPPSPAPADAGQFRFPVDDAVSLRTSYLEFEQPVTVYVHEPADGRMSEVGPFAAQSFPESEYVIEPLVDVKSYLRVTAPVDVYTEEGRTRIDFGAPTEVVLGSRSRHERPAATITTTGEPEDVMTALSHFGSALKTTSPERSFPTLRGHPPLIELGDELDVPEDLVRPETGVRIELPPDLGHVYVAAPLAYYLGAELRPADRPRLVTDAGFVHDLDGPAGFEGEVERVLRQTFFLDCLARTEGLYDIDLHERSAVETDPTLDLDFEALYERPLAERVEAYLRVPFDELESHLPDWTLTTHLEPTAEQAELLPFFVDDLAVIRSPTRDESTGSAAQMAAVEDFTRRADDFTRSVGAASDAPTTVVPESTSSIEQAWVGDGAPLGASRPTVTAFRNRLDRTPSDGDIDITVVCNDGSMREEHDFVTDAYGSRDDLPFDVTVHRNLTTTQLRDALAEPTEFLHYVGHIDEEGIECADGKLDARDLDSVGVDAFFLNACTSYRQGMALIEAGSIGGVVTYADVVNSGAVAVGCTLARLLDCGFPLRSGLDVASEESVVGSQYAVVGDGSLAIAQPKSGTPVLFELERSGEAFRLEIHGYPTSQAGIGAAFHPFFEESDRYYLNAGKIQEFDLSRSELAEFLELETVPVRVDGTLRWSDGLDTDTL